MEQVLRAAAPRTGPTPPTDAALPALAPADDGWDDDPDVHGPAAVAWTTWEGATTSLSFDRSHIEEFSDPNFALAFARIENHYFVNHGFMVEGQLLRDAHKLADIPTVIVQGRYDMCCPDVTAVDLSRALPSADL